MYFKIPLYEPLIGSLEKKYVNECLNTNWISSKGKFVSLFENKFKKFIKTPYAVSVCNGTAALHLALLALKIKANDEVLVPTFTYVATANAIKYVGAKVKFIDSKLNDWQIDEDQIQKQITKKTKAIIVPHIYGQVCNIQKISKICKKNKIFLIEDCAESIGTYYKGIHVGNFGDISTFSFFGSKTITTGEGGMVVTKNKNLSKLVERLKMVGVVKNKYYWHNMIGYNYRMTNICAAIGYGQMFNIDEILHKKRKIFTYYKKYLNKLPLKLHEEIKNTTHSYWLITIKLHNHKIRNKLIKYLKQNSIETRPTFYPVHTMPMYKTNKKLYFPNAKILSSSGINLPSGPLLRKDQIKFICSIIKKFLS